jgi:hypothetical protein
MSHPPDSLEKWCVSRSFAVRWHACCRHIGGIAFQSVPRVMEGHVEEIEELVVYGVTVGVAWGLLGGAPAVAPARDSPIVPDLDELREFYWRLETTSVAKLTRLARRFTARWGSRRHRGLYRGAGPRHRAHGGQARDRPDRHGLAQSALGPPGSRLGYDQLQGRHLLPMSRPSRQVKWQPRPVEALPPHVRSGVAASSGARCGDRRDFENFGANHARHIACTFSRRGRAHD